MREIVEKLAREGTLSDGELERLLETEVWDAALAAEADRVRRSIYGDEVYVRGLIEFTNYCKNNCYYCGIRRDNTHAARYRLSREQILDCCAAGYELGYRTFVLQGGEDPYFDDERVCGIVSAIRSGFPDCAITLSIGEKPRESYRRYFDAGANRYLLRHETANAAHYARLHPPQMSLENRRRCLYDLRDIGFKVGAGMMVGAPYQTTAHLVEDLRFLQALQPHMIGIGPYLPHHETPFAGEAAGSLTLTLRLLSVLRLMFPHALIPSTTALGTVHPRGQALGLQAGANVVMPNLSPAAVRKKYQIYENKAGSDEEAAASRLRLEKLVQEAGYRVVVARGDPK